ncbi:MAG: hypothetical protein LBB13_02950 [Rickettsiales bacterium]|jgi:MFS family permease|nr:hypothetical protein [Rickettsiales bacterium]
MFNIITKRFKKNRELNSYDLYKVVAFITMIMDHIGLFWVHEDDIMLRAVGRISNLIYSVLFGINRKKNSDRIFICGVIMQIMLTHHYNRIFPLGTLLNFCIANLLLDKFYDVYCDSNWPIGIFLLLLLPLGLLTSKCLEYGIFILALALCGRIFAKEEKTLKDTIVTAVIFFLYFLYQLLVFGFNPSNSMIIFALFTVLYLALFNFKFVEVKNCLCKSVIMLLSRYSAEMFIVQLLFFMIFNYVDF